MGHVLLPGHGLWTSAGARYQRVLTALFHDLMHKEVEVYVDDMIAKSWEKEVNLQKLFYRSRALQLRVI